MIVCPPQTVSFAPALLPLVTRFCACPDARALLVSDRVLPHLKIQATDGTARTAIFNDTHATIWISKNLPTDKGLADLIFEIFNTKPETFKKLKQMERRRQWDCDGMETWATNTERVEWETKKDLVHFREVCASAWNLPPDPQLDAEIFLDWDLYQFAMEIEGHTDQYRKNWIEDAQKSYCEAHPTDEHSCKAKKSDLIDDTEISEKEKFFRLATRICQLYPCAHERIKNHEAYKLSVKTFCPQVLSKECIQLKSVEHECNEIKLIESASNSDDSQFQDDLCKFFPTLHKRFKSNQPVLQEAYQAHCKSTVMSTTTLVATSALLCLATAIYRFHT